jgi:hypothetical protein
MAMCLLSIKSIDFEISDTWVQVTALKGDFYAQNVDVVQPGPIAPW